MTKSPASLFKPWSFKGLELTNRVVMAPMTRRKSPGNVPTDEVAAYYRRRTEGGVGLIITEGTYVPHKAANGYDSVPACYGDEAMAGWKKVIDEVHNAGGKIVPQLWHVGIVRQPGTEPDRSVPGYGPSEHHEEGKEASIAMTKADIDDVVAAFGDAAKNAKDAGFDGIEIHGAHGYLIDQFFWDGTNRRTDEYGGPMENRGRIANEIVAACRAAVGPDFPIIFRFSQWKMFDYKAKLANTAQELEAFLKPLSDAGVDIFHCSTRRFWLPEFEGSDLNLAGWVGKITGKPTITVGSVGLDDVSWAGAATTDVDDLITRLNAGEFDLVAVGRALISDPQWSNKVRDGKFEDIVAFDKDHLGVLT